MLKELGKIKQGDSLLDDKEIADATAYDLQKHFKEHYNFYHEWAEFFYDRMTTKDPQTHPRTIARLVAAMAEAEAELTRLFVSRGITEETPLISRLRFIIGLLAVENGKK